jgi:hypothetical protein
MGSLAAIGALLDLPAYPFWSLAVFALSIWIIYGLLVYQEPEDTYVGVGGAGMSVPSEEYARSRPPA